MKASGSEFQQIMKLKTLCVGGTFFAGTVPATEGHGFPRNVLSQIADFVFAHTQSFESALTLVSRNHDLDLVFLDADGNSLSGMTMFITQMREIRPRLPLIVFSNRVDDTMRHLLRAGAAWHFTKYADEIECLAQQLHQHVFSPVAWEDIFNYYARDDVRPRIEPGLSNIDLDTLRQYPEEQYIIKRLFANSDVVQIFRMDEGFSGSRIYTVKPRHQLKRIMKIGSIDDLEAVQDKQERLIQPRLYRQVGQIRGKVVTAQHLGGACYSLAGSNKDAITLSQFLQDQNRVRKELLDNILSQLHDSLSELYTGNSEKELRYWAPLYSRVLPPFFTLEDAELIPPTAADCNYELNANELTTISSVAGNQTLEAINNEFRRGKRPLVVLRDFEVAEIDTKTGILYLHDSLTTRYPSEPLFLGKEHPILRFKVHIRPSQRAMLTHPVFRRGKSVAIRGRIIDTQESILTRNIGEITGQEYDYASEVFEFASARFVPLLENIRYLLWEVGREDMILPMPIISPVVHGDLNASNILVEANHDVNLWLIDFSEARPGHIYGDLAKLEVEVRTHVFFRLFKEMVADHIWDEKTAIRCAMLIENMLILMPDSSFEEFTAALRNHQSDWYDALYTQFPLYFENLLYFLFSIRQIARLISPERFPQHYPVAMFFQSVMSLKYEPLNQEPWHPWAKRMALCCALVHGKEAVGRAKRPKDVTKLLGTLRQRSAQALIAVGEGENRRFLMQWNNHWERFNLVGGRINNEKGDRDSFARTMQRKLAEELGLKSPKDYRIVKELTPVIRQQFSRREHVFKDYEFRLFELELLPRHPRDAEEFHQFAQRISAEHENTLLSKGEIECLRTLVGQPISETARLLLQEIGEVQTDRNRDRSTMIELELDDLRPMVNRGRVQLTGSIVNAPYGHLIENVQVEVLPRPGYAIEPNSTFFRIDELDAGQGFPLEVWLQPREEDAKLTLRITYYDTRGNEYRQILDSPVQFRSAVFSLFHLDNPYIVGKPITTGNESLYVGREDVIAWIGGNLVGGSRPNSIILTGQPRIGKTSTLFQLVNGLLGRALREVPDHPVVPIYLDFQGLEVQGTGELFAWLCAVIARNLRNRGISVPAPTSWPSNGQGYQLFDRYLDEVELSLPANSLLVLVLDELERLQELIEIGHIDLDLLPYLRSLMQYRSRLAFILSGSGKLKTDFWQLVFNAGEQLELSTLNRRETEKLIREPVQPLVRYDELAVEHIWRATAGHPYLVQLVCHRLIQATGQEGGRQRMITVDQVHQILDQILEQDDNYLIQHWEGLDHSEQNVLTTLAELQGPADEAIPLAALVPDDGERGREIENALMRLTQDGLVKRINAAEPSSEFGHDMLEFGETNVAFVIPYGLFRRWIIEKKSPAYVM